MACFLVAVQVIYLPAHPFIADNTWHFQLARQIVEHGQVFWSAVDANRLFPDLMFGILAFVLPGGDSYPIWLYYYAGVLIVSLYASLVALASTLYEEHGERRCFLLAASSLLWLLVLASPFWDRWIFTPGNHGSGLPVCFASLAIALRMNGNRRVTLLGACGFVLAATLVMASNRYLLICLLLPFLIAVPVVALVRFRTRTTNRGLPFTGRASGSLASLIALTAISAISGYLTWRIVGALPWHRTVALGRTPVLPSSHYLGWLKSRFGKELLELGGALGQSWDITLGFAVVLATIPAALFLLRRLASEPQPTGLVENRTIFGLTAAFSGLLSGAFILIMVDDAGDWHYRFLTVPVILAVVLLASLPVRWQPFAGPGRRTAAAMAVPLLLLALTAYASDIRKRIYAPEERALEQSVRQLAQVIESRSPGYARGLSDYWRANDVSARSNSLRVATVDETGRFFFYNNDASDVCNHDYSFILHDLRRDLPRRDAIVSRLGEPDRVAQVELGRYGDIEILYYDPGVLDREILDPAKQAAAELFPTLKCAR